MATAPFLVLTQIDFILPFDGFLVVIHCCQPPQSEAVPKTSLVVAHAKAEAGQHGDGVARVAYGKLKHSNYSFRSPSQAECWHFIWQKRARLLDK